MEKARPIIITLCGLAALAAGLSVPGAALGYRFGILELGEAFTILRETAQPYVLVGLIAGGIGVLASLAPRPTPLIVLPVIGLVASGFAYYTPKKMGELVEANPFIHDISTDLENVPKFVAVAALRGEGDHPIAYEGTYDTRCGRGEGDCDPAALQLEAFPDIRPVDLEASWDEAFEIAKRAAKSMGWELVDVNPEQGRIEATDTTFWFGFKDDIVVRLTDLGDGRTRIDVRSQSRIGQSDLGANARRVRSYLSKLH